MSDFDKIAEITTDAVMNMIDSKIIEKIVQPQERFLMGNNLLKIQDDEGTHYFRITGTLKIIDFFPSSGGKIELARRVGEKGKLL